MKRARLGFLYLVLVLVLGLNIFAFVKRQWIGDWLALRNYTVPASIATIADQNTMTDAGRHLFYINHPSLENKSGFNQHCTSKTEHSVVLGCFHGDRQGIYIYDVQDERLEGVKQVTAAHEMLHQAYIRLSETERQKIDRLLTTFAQQGDFEQRIKDKIQLYTESEPGSLPNEMHSIFATEVRELPSELEIYYSRYFTDRTQVVSFSEKYQSEFAARKTKVDDYDRRLSDLNQQIESNKVQLELNQKNLTALRNEVERNLAAGNTAAYQADAPEYNKQVAAYNILIDKTQQLITQYNAIVAERNALSTEEQQLQKALDSRLQDPSGA